MAARWLTSTQIRAEARGGDRGRRARRAELEELRVRYLGPQVGADRDAALDRRPAAGGARPGRARRRTRCGRRSRRCSRERTAELEDAELDARLAEDRDRRDAARRPAAPAGRLHLITQTRREIEDIFVGLGFKVAEGPEVEYDYYNFTALNHPPEHPARMLQDTFYFSERRAAAHAHLADAGARDGGAGAADLHRRSRARRLPARHADATHTPMFHQVEGLAVDEDITLADLQGVLLEFARAMFGPEREVRLRPHYFPFTEPSVEVDISCFPCGGTGVLPGGWRATPLQGRGLDRDPRLGDGRPERVRLRGRHGYDPERVQGFAFGMGIERIAMLGHGVPDLRLFFDNDLRFLEQFGDEGPGRLAARVLRPRPAGRARSPTRLDLTGTEVERDRARRRRRPGRVRRRPGARGRAASGRRPADGVQGRRRRAASRARSSAARPTSRPARRWPSRGRARSCPTARSSARRSCAASSRAG